MVENRFEGQVAIVTGGADGIGRAVAQRLGREGARVALFDRNQNTLDQAVKDLGAEGIQATAWPVDVSDESQVREAVDGVAKENERLDVVVHCAGIVGPNGRDITQVELEEFEQVYAVNLRGSFLITRHALRHMQPQAYGRILLYASIAGKEGNAGMCAYSATKAGVIGLVKSVGKEFADTGITINALAPAVIRTQLVADMDPKQVEYMTSRIPMQRCGTLEEAASLTCWIVSPEAGFNTGFAFDLSGGRATY